MNNGGGDLSPDLPEFLCENDEIDRMIEEQAGAFNLTGTNIRNILYHVVLGVGGATDIWDPDEQDFLTPTEIPEPKTRAAKQKLLEQEAGGQLNLPLLTLPEVRSPVHSQEEDEEDEDQDYVPQDTECSDDSDEDADTLAASTPKSTAATPTHRKSKSSECDNEPTTPSAGLARRTRSLFSLKDRDLLELESALPEDVLKEDEEEEPGKSLQTPVPPKDPSPETWEGLEAALETEFDNISDGSSDISEDEKDHAADEGTFGQFLQGIVNPREEFPEDDSNMDMPYLYREKSQIEPEEFRTDKDVRVTKKEMVELYRDLEISHPDVNEQLNSRARHRQPSLDPVLESGPLFTATSLEVLKGQLQMHLQLLVQHIVLATGIDSLDNNRNTARKHIEELEEMCSAVSTEGLIQAMEGGRPPKSQSIVKCLDIYGALKIVDNGKYDPDQAVAPEQIIPTKVARGVQHIKHIGPLPMSKYNVLNYSRFFHKYLHIRPTVDFICRTKIKANANRCFTELEDNLLTHGLDAFQGVTEPKVVYHLIRDFFVPTKTAKQISIRVKNRTASIAPYNVIKHWKETGFIRYDTHYTTSQLMKSLSVPVEDIPVRFTSAINRENLDWLVALRDHRRKLQREHIKRKQKFVCTKETVMQTAKLASYDDNFGYEVAFLLKVNEVLKNDPSTYFHVFKLLAEYHQASEFDCKEVISKMLKVLRNYPDLGFEFLSIFSPLPDLPVEQLLEVLSHLKTRILLRNLERHFKSNPNQYKKVIKLILGANLNDPDAAKETLLSMLRGKQDLSDQVTEFFDKCAMKPKANDFEYIDLTDKTTMDFSNSDGFEEMSLLDKTCVSNQKHKRLVDSINKHHDEQRKREKDEKLAKILQEKENKLQKQEKRKMNAQNVIECGDTVLTWTREQDREILKSCRATGANYKTFKNLAKCFPDKTDSQVRDRYYILLKLMKKAQKAAVRKAKKSAKSSKQSATSSPTAHETKRQKLEDAQPGPSGESNYEHTAPSLL